MPCEVCHSSATATTKFLLTCIQCARQWHHRCHRPVITDKQLIVMIDLFNKRKDDPNRRFEWTCSACLNARNAPGHLGSGRSRTFADPNARGGSGSGSKSGSASGPKVTTTRPPQAPVVAKSVSARKPPSPILIDDDDDEIQIIDDTNEIAHTKSPPATSGAAQAQSQSQSQSRPQSQTQKTVPALIPAPAQAPVNPNRSAKAATARPVPAPQAAAPPTATAHLPTAAALPTPATRPTPSLPPAPPASNLKNNAAPTSSTRPPPSPSSSMPPPPAPARSSWSIPAPRPVRMPGRAQIPWPLPIRRPGPDALPNPNPIPVPRTQQATKSSSPSVGPQAGRKTVFSSAKSVTPQQRPTSTPKQTHTAPAQTPTPLAQSASAPLPSPSRISAIHGPAPRMVVDGARTQEEEDELDIYCTDEEDELDVDVDELEEEVNAKAKAGTSSTRAASKQTRAGQSKSATPRPAPNPSSVAVPQTRRIPEWINARAEAPTTAASSSADAPGPVLDVWSRRQRSITGSQRPDISASTAPAPTPARRSCKAFTVRHLAPSVADKGKEKEGTVRVDSKAPFVFTVDAWMVKRMGELRV